MNAEYIKNLRFERLDVLRGIAILMVIFYHSLGCVFKQDQLGWTTLGRDFSSAPHPAFLVFYPYTFGHLGVVLFFIISGFCIHWSYLRWEKNQPANAPLNLKSFVFEFYWRRFWRIYPPYAVALIVWALLSGYRFTTWPEIKDILLHATLLHNFNAGYFSSINHVFWSLAVEVQLYVVYPLVILLHRRLRMTSLLALIAFGMILREIHLPDLFQDRRLGFALNQLPFTYWPQWLAGAVVADLIAQGKKPPQWAGSALLMGIAVFAIYSQQSVLSIGADYLGYLVFALWIFMAASDQRPLGPVERALSAVGIVSYSLYMYHMLAYRPVAWITSPNPAWSPWWELSCGVLVVLLPLVGLSWLLYLFIEKKSEKLGATLRKRHPVPTSIALTAANSLK